MIIQQPANPYAFYEGLKAMVPNIPDRGVVAINLKLRPNKLPQMTIMLEPGLAEGRNVVQTFDLVPKVQT